MRAGVGLARKPHDGSILATNFLPVVELSAINIRNLLQCQLAYRVFRVYDHCNRIACDGVLNRVNTVRFCLIDLFLLDLAGCVGNIYCLVDDGSNARS